MLIFPCESRAKVFEVDPEIRSQDCPRCIINNPLQRVSGITRSEKSMKNARNITGTRVIKKRAFFFKPPLCEKIEIGFLPFHDVIFVFFMQERSSRIIFFFRQFVLPTHKEEKMLSRSAVALSSLVRPTTARLASSGSSTCPKYTPDRDTVNSKTEKNSMTYHFASTCRTKWLAQGFFPLSSL